MARLVTRISDRLLSRVVKNEDAGACVWNYGYTCGCYANRYQYLINCNGVCVRTSFACV